MAIGLKGPHFQKDMIGTSIRWYPLLGRRPNIESGSEAMQ